MDRDWMLDDEYRIEMGQHCPNLHCRSRNIEAGKPDVDGTYMSQEVTCHACGAEWTDVYELIGYNRNTNNRER